MAASLKRTSAYPNPGSNAQLPRGRHGLSRQFVAENQRERIIHAMVEAVAEQGYGEVAVADVIGRAGVSRKTFYENFKSKEDCFLTAYDALIGRLSSAGADAYREAERWTDGIRAVLRTTLETFSQDPALARVVLVEILAAGPRALERYDRAMHRVLPMLEAGREQSEHGPELPGKLAEEILGGVIQTLYMRVLEDQISTLEDSLGELLYFMLVPFLGHERALSAAFSAED